MKLIFTIVLFLFSNLTFAQTVIPIDQSVCDPYNVDPYKMRERIISKEVRNDSLIVVLGKRDICCANFNGSYLIENDTLKIKYENNGDECFCTCFYEITFKIPHYSNDSVPITFNDRQFIKTDKKLSEYTTKIDTLANGVIIQSEFENEHLIYEIEKQDSVIIYRQFYQGILRSERKIIKNNNK